MALDIWRRSNCTERERERGGGRRKEEEKEGSPKSAKETSQEDLQWDLEDDEGEGKEGRPANLAVHEEGEGGEMERTYPEEVQEEESQVESLDVVGGQVDHMTSGHLAQGHLTQL